MSDKSAIEWTDATWNPTTGCDRVSPGCANCYALDLAARLKRMGAPAYQRDGDPKTSGPGFGLTLHVERLKIPVGWTRPRRIFVNSMSDLFHPQVPDLFIAGVWAAMESAPQHTFQVLTKRPERMRELLTRGFYAGLVRRAGYDLMGSAYRPNNPGWPLPNVWIGTSVENARWRTRIDELRATPAAVRFLSCEPLLGPLVDVSLLDQLQVGADFYRYNGLRLDGIDWVIAGGESGPNHRPVDIQWVRDIRDECIRQGVAFFFKQWGGRTPKSGGRELDGHTWEQFPVAVA